MEADDGQNSLGAAVPRLAAELEADSRFAATLRRSAARESIPRKIFGGGGPWREHGASSRRVLRGRVELRALVRLRRAR